MAHNRDPRMIRGYRSQAMSTPFKHCHPSRRLFRAGDLLFGFASFDDSRSPAPQLKSWQDQQPRGGARDDSACVLLAALANLGRRPLAGKVIGQQHFRNTRAQITNDKANTAMKQSLSF